MSDPKYSIVVPFCFSKVSCVQRRGLVRRATSLRAWPGSLHSCPQLLSRSFPDAMSWVAFLFLVLLWCYFHFKAMDHRLNLLETIGQSKPPLLLLAHKVFFPSNRKVTNTKTLEDFCLKKKKIKPPLCIDGRTRKDLAKSTVREKAFLL